MFICHNWAVSVVACSGTGGEGVWNSNSSGEEGEHWDTMSSPRQWEGNTQEAVSEALAHLAKPRSEALRRIFENYPTVFGEHPGLTNICAHDVDVGDSPPFKSVPYRVSPLKLPALKTEIEYMLSHGLIERGPVEWSSPVTLVPKADGTVRFCIDYRRLNGISTTDAYPLPRVDDCVDQVGRARYLTKVDLVKGYWQVPLTKRAQEVCGFVVGGETYRCLVMPYGLKNAPATFQALMNRIVAEIPHTTVYLDDVLIYDDDFEEHVQHIELLVSGLADAGLVVNLKKCEFVKATVEYLGYVVGLGQVPPPPRLKCRPSRSSPSQRPRNRS